MIEIKLVFRSIKFIHCPVEAFFQNAFCSQDRPINHFIDGQVREHGKWVKDGRKPFWRALKGLTAGEANACVMTVNEEGGYIAWRRLNENFEPGLTARQGNVLFDLNALGQKQAKKPRTRGGCYSSWQQK